jgi:hypothetical protein
MTCGYENLTFQVTNTKMLNLTAMPLRGWCRDTFAVPRATLRFGGYRNYTPYGVVCNAQNYPTITNFAR